jgi:mRNA-degrading endonuclease RelE of RelBE toxin-antitoxin system
LGPSYRVLIHDKVKQQLSSFVTNHPKSLQDSIQKKIITALKKLKSDPTGTANVPFHENKNKMLIGKIRKMHIGGRKNYRLLNLCISEKKTVLPIYISEVKRGDFDYDKVPWQSIAEEIYKDFLDGTTEKFSTI